MSVIPEVKGYAVSAIAVTDHDLLWLGTNGQGLHYFDGKTWHEPPQAVSPPAQSIRAIVVDRNGSTWIAGVEGGTLRYVP